MAEGSWGQLTCPHYYYLKKILDYVPYLNTKKSPCFNDSKSQPSL